MIRKMHYSDMSDFVHRIVGNHLPDFEIYVVSTSACVIIEFPNFEEEDGFENRITQAMDELFLSTYFSHYYVLDNVVGSYKLVLAYSQSVQVGE